MKLVKGLAVSVVVLIGLLTAALAIAITAFVRLKDVEGDIKHYRSVIYTIVENIHEALLKDPAYRHFDQERRIAEVKSIVDFVIPRCVKYAPAERREDLIQHAEAIIPEIVEKE